MLYPFLVSPPKIPYPLPHLPAPQPTHSHSWSWHFPILGHSTFIGPRASPPIDGQLGHPLLHIQLESQVPPFLFSDWWFSSKEFSGVLISSYWCSSYGASNPFSSLGTFSTSSIGGHLFHPIDDDFEPPLLYLPGTGIASLKSDISGSCRQNLAGIFNWVCIQWLIPE